MDQQVPEEALHDLAGTLSCYPTLLAKDLGLPNSTIICIQEDYPDDSRERRYQILRRWRQSSPAQATWGALIQATESGVREVMNKYVGEIHTSNKENEMAELCCYYPVTKLQSLERRVDKLECITNITHKDNPPTPEEKEHSRKRKGNLYDKQRDTKRQSTIPEFYTRN